MQLVWLFTLTGGVLVYAIQNIGEYNYGDNIRNISDDYRYQTTTAIMAIIAQRFDRSLPPMTIAQLGQQYRLPVNLITPEIERLHSLGLVNFIECGRQENNERKVQPAVNCANLTVADLTERLANFGAKDFIPESKHNYSYVIQAFSKIQHTVKVSEAQVRLLDIPIKHETNTSNHKTKSK